MSGPLIAGYDGSECSQDALALSRLLATPLESGVVVLSVLTLAPVEATAIVYEEALREQERTLADEARAALAGIEPLETVAIPGFSPAHLLNELAEQRSARMVVLGATHRHGLGRVFPGSVADRLLSGSPCPVAVAPRGLAERSAELSSIAVAYDGSAESDLALGLACELAEASSSKLTLIAVTGRYLPLASAAAAAQGWAAYASDEAAMASARRYAEKLLAGGRERVPAGVEAASELVEELDPGAALLEASQRFDLLLIGSRGYGPLGRVLLGGVSSHVIRGASCPVIVTPRPAS